MGSGTQVITIAIPPTGVGAPVLVNGKQIMGYEVDNLPNNTSFQVLHSLDDPSGPPPTTNVQPAAEDQSDSTTIAANGTLQPLIQVTNWLVAKRVTGDPSPTLLRVMTVGLAPWQTGLTLQAKIFNSIVDLCTFINDPTKGVSSIVTITTDNSGKFTLIYS